MLTHTTLILDTKKENSLTYNASSLFQGVLMENVSAEYGEILHYDGLKPYSQYIYKENEQVIWTINTLNENAAQNLLKPILSDQFKQIKLEQKNLELAVLEKNKEEKKYETLLMETFFGECARYITIRFKTPTAFKKDGKYLFHPTVWHIFKSLTNKFDACSFDSEIGFQKNLEDIEKYVEIIKYSLKSTFFYLESIKIPAFVGTVTLKIGGPQQLVNLIHLLLRFGEFSGVGIKCAMGMGAIKILERKEQHVNGYKND